MTYALGHEKELPNRSIRRRMGVPGVPCSGSRQARTTENPHQPRDPQRHLLRPQKRLPLEALAPRLRTPWETIYWWFRKLKSEDEVLVFLVAHEAFHYLLKTKQVEGRHGEMEAD